MDDEGGGRLRVQDRPRLRNTLAAVRAQTGCLPDGLQATAAFVGQLGEIPFPDIEAVANDHGAMHFRNEPGRSPFAAV
jgi:hypothetical protein